MGRKKIANNFQQQKYLKDIILKLNTITKNVDTLVDANKSCKDPAEVCGNTEAQFLRHKNENSKIKLNVDGAVFSCSMRELRKYPDTRLGKIAESSSICEILQICDDYAASSNEFFFSKRNNNFPDILEFYRTGSLHISSDHCVFAFCQDLEYWGVSSSYLQPCCANKLADSKDMMEKDQDCLEKTLHVDPFPGGSKGRMQKKIWNLFENPYSSKLAAMISIVSMFSILISIITLTLKLKDQDSDNFQCRVFAIIETVCISWFGFEFLVRLISCPNKVVFFKQFMNWIDIFVIVPYIIIVVIESHLFGHGCAAQTKREDNVNVWYGVEEGQKIFEVLRLLRIMKPLIFMARFFKLARHSTGMVALGQTLKSKYKELCLVLLFLGMGTIIFASMFFIAEVEYKPKMVAKATNITTNKTMSMFDAYWWAVITMTTVGYGDITPKTNIGKGIGTICAIFGVLVVTLPIPIIGNSFDTFYRQEKRRVKLLARNAQDKNNSCKLEEDSAEDRFSYTTALSSDLTGHMDIFYSDSVQLTTISNPREVTTVLI